MKVTVFADDGKSCSIVISQTATATQVLESYCKVRKLSGHSLGAATTAVNANDCILTYEPSDNSESQFLSADTQVATLLQTSNSSSSQDKNGKLIVLGFKDSQTSNNLTQIYSLAAQMSSASLLLSKALQNTVASSNTIPDTENLQFSDKVFARLQSFVADANQLLDSELQKEQNNKDTIHAAKGKEDYILLLFLGIFLKHKFICRCT